MSRDDFTVSKWALVQIVGYVVLVLGVIVTLTRLTTTMENGIAGNAAAVKELKQYHGETVKALTNHEGRISRLEGRQ